MNPSGAQAENPAQRSGDSGRPIGVAVAALVFGVTGWFFVAIPFGICALLRIPRGVRGRGLAATGLVCSGVWVLLLCAYLAGWIGVGKPESSIGDRVVSIDELSTGQCVNGLPATHPKTLTLRSCTQPHDAEVVYDFELPPGPWPGEIEINRQVGLRCAPALSAAMQANRGGRPLRNYCVRPMDSTDWESVRRISCLVLSKSGEQLTAPILR
ncbi:DUF4190 domain-containing protein [Nocardia arthritidis]|uniref:DUF4190 domain-containing protein n=1 Tax=Nocardia arthritidis TaxID=228602 RepID=UPI00142E5036|nr:DUF4190 domain-containing protein [Nocardia arthritidis]